MLVFLFIVHSQLGSAHHLALIVLAVLFSVVTC